MGVYTRVSSWCPLEERPHDVVAGGDEGGFGLDGDVFVELIPTGWA